MSLYEGSWILKCIWSLLLLKTISSYQINHHVTDRWHMIYLFPKERCLTVCFSAAYVHMRIKILMVVKRAIFPLSGILLFARFYGDCTGSFTVVGFEIIWRMSFFTLFMSNDQLCAALNIQEQKSSTLIILPLRPCDFSDKCCHTCAFKISNLLFSKLPFFFFFFVQLFCEDLKC